VRWTVRGRRRVYTSEWVDVWVDEVQAGAKRFEHHVVRLPKPTISAVVVDDHDRVLLLWRHRFITDSWGWEIPAGGLEAGETPEAAAEREAVEETGWRPGPLRRLGSYHPSNGTSDQVFHVFVADGATQVGAPVDLHESDRIDWVPVDEVRKLIADGQIGDGLSLTTLLWMLAMATDLG
jgi:8-oxo-dGTP pyrophosphatase MutT (NUDIX family)